MMKTTGRTTLVGALVLVAAVALAAGAGAQSRSVGQVIDDATITTEVKAKLTADRLANLTQIGVNTRHGVVTLSGTVDSLERQARAVQIAGGVKGVRTVINNIQVTGVSSAPPPPPSTTLPPAALVPEPSPVDVTGVVSQVDPATGTIILQDGRVLRMTSETVVWQPGAITALRPGTQVLIRGAAPLRVQGEAAGGWRMGTVQSVEPAASRIVLTDGTIVRLSPTVDVRRDSERLALEQLTPGTEIVIRPSAPPPTAVAGSALPAPTATAAVIDAAEVNVVWTPRVR